MMVNNFDNYICMHHSVRFLSFLPRRSFLDSYSGSSAHHECYRYEQEQNISSRQSLRHHPAPVDLTPPDIQTCKKMKKNIESKMRALYKTYMYIPEVTAGCLWVRLVIDCKLALPFFTALFIKPNSWVLEKIFCLHSIFKEFGKSVILTGTF